MKGETIVLGLMVILALVLCCVCFGALTEEARRHQELNYGKPIYETWVKYVKRPDISYDEWLKLKKAGLLEETK